MSEQFAMQPDEFDSTNNRLDSILDRLNALGESAASMKDAPLRPLQSVPPIDSNTPGVVESAPPTPPPNLGLVPPVDHAPVVDGPAAAIEQPEVEQMHAQPVVSEVVAPAPVDQTPPPVLPTVPTPAVEVTPPEVAAAESSVFESSLVDDIANDLPPLPDVPSLPDELVSDPGPIEVEHNGLDLNPTPLVGQTPAANEAELMESAAVFELDPATLEAEAAIEPPEAPTSIFSLSTAEPAIAAPEEEGDGWISHHGDEPAVDEPTAEVDGEDISENVDPMWAIDPVEQAAGDEEASIFTEAGVDGVFSEGSATGGPAPVADPIDEIFAVLEGADEDFVDISELDDIANISELDAEPLSLDFDADIVVEEAFASDDDLPIPDFTGVYDETAVEGRFWADSDDNVPKGVEGSIGQISARRDELDKLRPVEGEEPAAVEKEPVERSAMLQIVGVIFVGILAVLAVFLLDPAAVADMRESIEGLVP